MPDNTKIFQPVIEKVVEFQSGDLEQLCDVADEAIIDGNGFGWLNPPPRQIQEAFWKGIMLMPFRELYVARLDGDIVGTGQLVKPFDNNEAGRHIAQIATFFIGPNVRGHGLGLGLLSVIEMSAREQGFKILEVDVRETQNAAISLISNAGFERWGVKSDYAWTGDQFVDGFYYKKYLEAAS